MTLGELQAGASKWRLTHPYNVFKRALYMAVGRNPAYIEYQCRKRLAEIVWLAEMADRPLSDIAADLDRELRGVVEKRTDVSK
jgi:hypothetical protein